MRSIRLPLPDGRFEDYRIRNAPLEPVSASAQAGNASRIAYSAVHVVADPLADNDPWLDAAIDWDKTVAFRNYIGTSVSASPKPWTPPSAAWASTGRRRWSSFAARSMPQRTGRAH